jgi:hypothetical protein
VDVEPGRDLDGGQLWAAPAEVFDCRSDSQASRPTRVGRAVARWRLTLLAAGSLSIGLVFLAMGILGHWTSSLVVLCALNLFNGVLSSAQWLRRGRQDGLNDSRRP